MNSVYKDEATMAYAVVHGSVEGMRDKSKPGSAKTNILKEYETPTEEEIPDHRENGALPLVGIIELAKETRSFGSKFIDSIKVADNGIRYKSQLVAKHYSDKDAETIVTKASTVQRFVQRLIPSLLASLESIGCHTRDITQGYTLFTASLQRDLYIGPLPEIGITSGKVLKVLKQ